MRDVAMCLLVSACGATSDDVVGPFTGQTHRYVLDAIYLPVSNTDARLLGGDLDGNGVVDNQLGMVISTLRSQHNVTEHAADMIAGGAVTTSLELVADDLRSDPAVGIRYLGGPDSPATTFGGRFEDGWFRSNLTAVSDVPAEAQLHLPVFAEADPSVIDAIGVQIILQPDGNGGFHATVHAGIPTGPAFTAIVHRGITQMIASEPSAHRTFTNLLDDTKDGVISYEEVATNSLLVSLLAPDITLDGRDALAIGFRAHFVPCATGACNQGVSFDACFDRVRDGDETDVDCGGSCRPCEAGASCSLASDCETIRCDAGRCGPPSCFNGARDGLESDIDCGGDCSFDCEVGERCYFGTDCVSQECGVPCVSDDVLDCLDFDFSAHTCYPPP